MTNRCSCPGVHSCLEYEAYRRSEENKKKKVSRKRFVIEYEGEGKTNE